MASVLVVEDEIDARDALCTYLARVGHTVQSAGSGREALVSILSKAPDVVVLDLLMPGMDGSGVLEVIRSYLRLQSLPVVVWTGAGESPVMERARRLKVDAVLTKPKASFPDILDAIERAVRRTPD